MPDLTEKCLTPRCSQLARTRGLCARCYTAAANAISKGQVTWEKLEELGLSKASQRDKGHAALFQNALQEALQGEANAKALGWPTGK